jgi:hypothetical protein
MTNIVQHPLPDNIDPEWLRALQKKAVARRKAEEMVREILGENTAEPEMSLGEYILTFPEIDCDDSIFARHPGRESSNVSG